MGVGADALVERLSQLAAAKHVAGDPRAWPAMEAGCKFASQILQEGHDPKYESCLRLLVDAMDRSRVEPIPARLAPLEVRGGAVALWPEAPGGEALAAEAAVQGAGPAIREPLPSGPDLEAFVKLLVEEVRHLRGQVADLRVQIQAGAPKRSPGSVLGERVRRWREETGNGALVSKTAAPGRRR